MSRRSVSIPLEHLDAELIAAPLADPAAFTSAVARLDPRLRASGSQALWRSVEGRLAGALPGISLDELIARRDRHWFGQPGAAGARPMAEVLAWIGPYVGGAESWADGTPHAQRRRLRWLSFALPPGLITTMAPTLPAPMTPHIERLLGRGLVESHVHLGAAIDFDSLWIAVQHGFATTMDADAFRSPGAAFAEGRDLAGWLLQGLVARGVLACFCARSRPAPFDRWWQGFGGGLKPTDLAVVTQALRAVTRGRRETPLDFDRLQSLYRHLMGLGPGRWQLDPNKTRLDELRRRDGLRAWFPATARASSERQFMERGLAYMRASPQDRAFEALFWQCMRLKVALYRHLVQRPMVGGLQWFTRTFGRIAAARAALPLPALVDAAHRLARPADAVEVRFKPKPSLSALRQQLAAIARASGDRPMGMVLSFTRSRGPDHKQGRPAAHELDAYAEPGFRGSPFRYGAYYREARDQALAIIELLRTRPRSVESIRGIDVCGDELAVPLWVLAPLLSGVRAVGRSAAGFCSRPERPVSPLRLMVHAGEDYVHLLGGLRRIDAFVEHLDLGEGDRITHALALGEDVERWCSAAYRRVQTREERLLDLMWAWCRASETPGELFAEWGSWLERQIIALGRAIFGSTPQAPTVADLVEARRALYNPLALVALGFPNASTGPVPDALSLTRRWITDIDVFRRSRELVEVDPNKTASLMSALQRVVRQRLGDRSIVVEINPSSNLLVGAFDDLDQHPFWRVRPPEGSESPSLMVSIGSDDPLTFATSLSGEYQLVYDTLVGGGVPPDRATAWLDGVRRSSLLARVTLDAPAKPSEWRRAIAPLPGVLLPG